MERQITVVAGRERQVVGQMSPQEGMKTNEGKIERVTKAGVVHLDSGVRVNKPERLQVLQSEARRFGYGKTVGDSLCAA